MKLSSVPVGPSGGQVPCSACGAAIDPLRAGHVAIFDAKFHYFCNTHRCRARFLGQTPTPRPRPGAGQRVAGQGAARAPELMQAVTRPVRGAEATPPADTTVPDRIRVDEAAELIEPLGRSEPDGSLPASVEPARRDMSGLLVALAAVAGVLAMALDFAQPSRLVLAARAILVAVGACALCGRALTTRTDAAEPNRLVAVTPALLATGLSVWAMLSSEPSVAARTAFFAATIVTVTAATLWLVGVAARPVVATRRWVERRLDVVGQRVAADAAAGARELAADIRPGELVVVQAGETVPVDLELTEGDVEIVPWIGAAHRVRRRAGDFAIAGARVVQGQLRGVCTWTDDDRAFARPLLAPQRRCDVHGAIAATSRAVVQRWAWVAAVAAGVVATLVTIGTRPIEVAMVTVAVGAALGNVAVGSIAGLSIARGVRVALSRGIVHAGAEAWDVCSQVSAAVFCARGTLLRGEPELAEVETFSEQADRQQVLALAAGAVGVERSPWAIALRRGARARGLSPEPVRNPRSLPGSGATAIGTSGEELCVGTRALMVERRISMAIAEKRVSELEALGRTVMLVSRGGRLIGLTALQDGLRSGARAAVQHLLDAGIEPVLVSADSRETCEALGRSLDIEHLRPEVAEKDRADAIARIKDTGAVVAVLGHSPFDDAALSAADAAVALAAAGRTPDDGSASLVSDDVRDAAMALAVAHRTRRQAIQVLALVLVPAIFGALVVTAGLLPPEYAPLALLLGCSAAVAHLRSWDHAVHSKS